MSGIKRERWTESDLMLLAGGEHDYFDRKSGLMLQDRDFRDDLAKALSAFANSGGGHIILGMTDTGSIDGVPDNLKGRTRTRDWLEQIIPGLVAYRLEDFRVHEAIPDEPSSIPGGKVLIVIDVGDSALAPHQTSGTCAYYHREGGRSCPASHFYLEMLRNRLTAPVLTATLERVDATDASRLGSGSRFVLLTLSFRIHNNGRSAAYRWALVFEGLNGLSDDRAQDVMREASQFPVKVANRGIRLDDTILPSMGTMVEQHIGVCLRASPADPDWVLPELRSVLPGTATACFRVVTECSPGEELQVPLDTVIDYEQLAKTSHEKIRGVH